ncbi:hypothetical protein NEMBOFW57_000496 [Staphylotrichum longicolle]|uniref:Heterokaryon incompatibility domain-containing protein n=1 Tax=Staphylotrichum longicolle TaxID=669026 RepID=A0AAD4HX49_9PEZI|nr:hypothetical protein NEMBOFW57_000496 [Staphylotrichum longicolle]
MHVRVLELHPGSGDQPLSGTLRSISLESLVECEALSYVWGTPSGGEIDLGSGQCLSIGFNLKEALHYIRHPQRPRMLWIDAICINQDDIHEKSHQVQLMAEIYSRCESVLVWLGTATPHSHLGLEILSYLANSDRRFDNGSAPWERVPDITVGAALRDILERPYFQRLWVVQEAALARRVTMQLGHTCIEWSSGTPTRKFLARIKLAELSPSWEQSGQLRNAIDFQPMRELLEQSLATDAKRRGVLEVPSLLDVVHSIRHRKVVDPRDRIYGVMSLAVPGEIANLVPDYTLSWEETYRRFYDLVHSRVLQDPEASFEDIRRGF